LQRRRRAAFHQGSVNRDRHPQVRASAFNACPSGCAGKLRLRDVDMAVWLLAAWA
jgi:hypothetical protein